MSFLATAIVGAAVVGGVGTAIAGNQAAKATEGSTNAAINEQNSALAQEANLSAPYRALGSSAIGQYQDLLGIGGKGSAGVESTLAATPGYNFAKTQGLTATTNAATAAGIGLSGNTLEGLDQFSTGLADSTYQNAVQNAQGAVGIGQAAASGQAANIGSAASNISNSLINQGSNIAGIDVNTIAGISKAGSNAAGQYVTANTLAGLSNSGSGGLTEYNPTNTTQIGGWS
jgi:hypothetical protein